MADLPWLCPEHPDAQIRQEWTVTRHTARLTGASWETREAGSERCYCATCGRELAVPEPKEE